MDMTGPKAKKIIKAKLEKMGIEGCTLKARTLHFESLWETRVFVDVIGWEPSPKWMELEAVAKANGFSVEAHGFITA